MAVRADGWFRQVAFRLVAPGGSPYLGGLSSRSRTWVGLSSTWVPTVPHDPARRVPVPSQVRGFERDDDDVAHTWEDLLLTARAGVGLASLGRVYAAHDDAIWGARGEVNQVL